MSKIKVGDKIRCISVGKLGTESLPWAMLNGCEVSKIYEVENIYAPPEPDGAESYIRLTGVVGFWVDSRHFEKVIYKESILKRLIALWVKLKMIKIGGYNG